MVKFMDYMISQSPLRVVNPTVDISKLSIKSMTISEMGHLPGRTLRRKDVIFNSWAFGYIVGGQGTYQVNEGPIQKVKKGSLFFVFPNAAFHYGPEENGYWDEYYIRFEGPRIQEWLQNWLFETDTVKDVGWDETSISKLEMIINLIDSGVPANVDRASLLLEALLFEWVQKDSDPQQLIAKRHIGQVISDLSHSIYEPLNAVKLAERNHISIPTLRRIVSQYTGYPFNDYMHRLKIAEAKRLLLNTDISIKDISDTLCYKDVFYFSRLFKKYVGIAPQHYRKNV